MCRADSVTQYRRCLPSLQLSSEWLRLRGIKRVIRDALIAPVLAESTAKACRLAIQSHHILVYTGQIFVDAFIQNNIKSS